MVRPVTCPVCSKPVIPAGDPSSDHSPFCSQRCKQVDFFRWTDGRYAIVETLTQEQLAIRLSEVKTEEASEIDGELGD